MLFRSVVVVLEDAVTEAVAGRVRPRAARGQGRGRPEATVVLVAQVEGLAARIGAPHTLLWCGAITLAASLWFSRRLPSIRAEVRPLYIKLGILPEMAMAVQQASALQTPPED